jgi:hypothetical protein
MHEVSHGTSAKRMADMHAVLRRDLHSGRKTRDVSFGLGARGVRMIVSSMGWANRQAVVLFRTSCGMSDVPMLFCHPTAAHLAAFYLAIARPAVWASPFLRSSSPNCDRTKNQTNAPAADRSQVCCSRYAESLVTVRASRVARSSEARTQELRRLCPLFAERAQEGGKQTGLGRTW